MNIYEVDGNIREVEGDAGYVEYFCGCWSGFRG